jgi:ribonucleoside-diphosphate reductase alpha chain
MSQTAADPHLAAPISEEPRPPGLNITRFFTTAGISPYDTLEWESRKAQITNGKGETLFEQNDVEVPKAWSMTATSIVASKYLHGSLNTPERETGVRQLVSRVAETIRDWGRNAKYFRTDQDAEAFHDELVYILLHQVAAFNSPVWFNVGCDRIEPTANSQNWHWNANSNQVEFGPTGYKNPQCSACFINSVQDTMDSILSLAKTEGMLFKWGSGTGTNLSPLRGSMEQLSGGGTASGPLSFMKGFDTFAGVIKSGGKTRRAAKMVILNIDHPDIVEFIECKAKEEAKAWALAKAGYDASGPDAEAYSSIFFQNANNSVRVTDVFLLAVERGAEFSTRTVKGGQVVGTFRARDILRKIAEAAWKCGDPGIQFDSTINRWHTSSNSGRINASNPCSEYMFLDDSACNLASLNLVKFTTDDGFDVNAFRHAVDIMITAQEILIDFSGYPTKLIAQNAHDYRPLGLGYANLGALLMGSGLPYDSDAGREYAACITAIMCGEAYKQSALIARECSPLVGSTDALDGKVQFGGACPGFYLNRAPFLDVIKMHRAAVDGICPVGSNSPTVASLMSVCKAVWDEALDNGERFGYRNSQVTVLAPTGTIGFMMDCDTTGIEPDLALVKYKKLVGGGMMKIVNNRVGPALLMLGYSTEQVQAIVCHIDGTGTIEGAPGLHTEHLSVFDCSLRPTKGTRFIKPMGHLRMMAATQPFISGAISKTVNLPESTTPETIMQIYLEAWRLGLKSVAVYRDGCKKAQPLSPLAASNITQPAAGETQIQDQQPISQENAQGPPRAVRNHLPQERISRTHKFEIAGHDGFVTVGLYPNGQPGEIFVGMAKGGSTLAGLMDSFAIAISLSLQHGVPLKLLCDKFSHTRFEPSGWTSNPDIRYAKSIMDYLFRWLQARFIDGQQGTLFPQLPVVQTTVMASSSTLITEAKAEHPLDALAELVEFGDAPTCRTCGALTSRQGSCYRCSTCGESFGACS